MSDRRIDVEDLGELEALPPDDPRRRALDSQPRARALLRAYRSFMTPSPLPDDARHVEAEARLAETLEEALGTTLDAEARPARDGSGRRVRPTPGWRRMGWTPRALAIAAALLVVAAVGLLRITARRDGGEPLMRGQTPPASDAALVATVRPLAGGALRLSWTPLAEADRYGVVFLSANLDEIARVDDLHHESLDLRREALPPGLTSGQQVLGRVVAWRGADEVARSRTLSLTLP